MPRGLVFHVPPANVDTIFIYSWLMSVLAGNRNVIRLSSREPTR
ncbi:acyl-CoA reductase [Deinococcus caeni]